MDKVIQQSLAKIQSLTKNTFQWQPDQPWHQPLYTYEGGHWSQYMQSSIQQTFQSFALYSWNIDFMLPYPDSRMRQALKHLQAQLAARTSTMATVIFLQECTQTDIALIANDSWIQQHFLVSDLDGSNWTSGWYGTITLIDKRLSVVSAFRIHYAQTVMERDAFFTDIQIGRQTIRLCNSHLESMAFNPPRRPHQLALAAHYMHESNGAVIAGDFNAVQDFDRKLHTDNNLKDAYLESGGVEDAENGYTWGQQASTALRTQFGLSRMDKVFYCGALQLQSFATFGTDVQLNDTNEREEVVALGFDKPWITDHLGVKAMFTIQDTADQKL